MKTETIEIKIITPAKGKWLFDGEQISDRVINPREGVWREITDAEKQEIEAAREAEIVEEDAE